MSISASDPRLAEFPPALRALVEAELAAGNTVLEIGHGFPAPPVGAYVKLGRAVTTRERRSTPELSFYDRHSSLYSGEWTDARRFFFVIEPPRPPDEPPPLTASSPAEPGATGARTSPKPSSRSDALTEFEAEVRSRLRTVFLSGRVKRFRESMNIDYEKWREGIGYDLTLLDEATPEERRDIERMLLTRGARDWRDVEALARFDSAAARRELERVFAGPDAALRGAVLRYRPDLVGEPQKREHLIEALRTAEFYGGLSEALDAVAEFHPPEIVREVFHGALGRSGTEAVHFAGLLLFLFGQAKSRFDWDERPFLLTFATPDPAARRAAFISLCDRIGVDPQPYLNEAAGHAAGQPGS